MSRAFYNDTCCYTLQCFDTTSLSPARAGAHKALDVQKDELPVWSKSTLSYK